MTVEELERYLVENGAHFQIIRQDRAILSASDAAAHYPAGRAATTFVLQTEGGLIGCIASAASGRLDFERLRRRFGFSRLRLADRERILAQTGFAAGAVPLVGLDLPCLFDANLLRFDEIYGGTGDELLTLRISPGDALRLNRVIGMFNEDESARERKEPER